MTTDAQREPSGVGRGGRHRAARPAHHANEYRWPIGSPVTPRALSVLAEYLIHGSYGEAAACLGIVEKTAHGHGEQVMSRTGATSIAQAAYLLGWVTFPEGLGH